MRQHREKKTAVLCARCENKLLHYLENVAAVRRLDTSDIIREALWEYAARTRRKYGNV